jgi:hypothetical protein
VDLLKLSLVMPQEVGEPFMQVPILLEVEGILVEDGLEEREILGLEEVIHRLELIPVELNSLPMSERETEVIELL